MTLPPKTAGDAAAITTAAAAIFNAIPWPHIAGFLSCVWLVLRIIDWFRGRRE